MHAPQPSRAVKTLLTILLTAACCARADEIRNTSRPKVGLVLGGGGALGIAHIGVLRVLEQERVPIDYICGTSMGAIIAGLYASGMSPDEIEAFLLGVDWDEAMTDNTPRRELYFRRKLEDQRYLVSLGMGRKGVKLGTGLVAGQKFNNLLQLQVQRAATITDFNQLSIPYRAVATDLETGRPFVFDHGSLARVMRASMAVPGAFTAVEIDGKMFVDGGIVANMPVDVARSMGAEYIIAVDVGSSSDKVQREKLRSMVGILGRTYAIAQRPEQLEQFATADIGLQPDLDGMSAGQFSRVGEFVPRGEAIARTRLDDLRRLRVSEAEFEAYLARHRRANPENVRIESIGVSGQQRVSEAAIRGRIQSKPGETFDPAKMQLDLMRIYGIGEFEQILYRLEQQQEGAGVLGYEVTESPEGPLYLNVGLNLRSDFQDDADWNMLINLTRRSLNGLGGEWRNEVVLGSTQDVLSEFYQPVDHGGYIFLAPTIHYRSELQDVYNHKDHIAEYDVSTLAGILDVGIQLRHYAELRAGLAGGTATAEVDTGANTLPDYDDKFLGPRIQLVVDRQDRTYFARNGYYLGINGIFPEEDLGGEVSFNRIEGDARLYHSIADHTFILGMKLGSSLGSGLPDYVQFTLGGPSSFAGLARHQFRGETLAVGSIGYQYRLKTLPPQLGKGIYALTRYDVGNVWQSNEIETDDLRHGLAIGFGIDTRFGPLSATYGVADGGYGRFYFSLGSEF